MKSCLEQFTDKPVLVQLKNALLSSISAEPVELGEGETCGSATLAFLPPANAGEQSQPVMTQVLRGNIESFDDTHLQVGTLGGDNRTPVRILVERTNVASVTFCVEHVETQSAEPSKIVTP